MNSKNKESKAKLNAVVDELEQIWLALKSDLRMLSNKLQQSDYTAAQFYKLPPILKDEESINHDEIEVETWKGRKALLESCASYNNMYIQEGWSTKAVQRHPGFIQLPESSYEEFAPIIERINKSKHAFQETVTRLPSQRERWTAVRQIAYMLMTKAIYRQIVTYAPTPVPVVSLTFLWAHKAGIRKISREAAIQQLERHRECPMHGIEERIWERRIDIDVQKIQNLPEGFGLRLKRPLKAQPMANLQRADGKWSQVNAVLPLLIFSDARIDIDGLYHYNSLHRRQRNDSTISEEPIADTLNIFVADERNN